VPLDAEYNIGRSWAGEPLGNAPENDQHTGTKSETADNEVQDSEPDVSAGDNRATGDAPLPWLTPALTELPRGSAEFAAILALLSEEECAVVRAPEAPRENGEDHGGEKPAQATKLNRSPSRGSNKIICPFHNDHNPSLELYSDGHYHCYACGAHGAIEELPEAALAPTSDAAQASTDTLKLGIQLWEAANPIHATLAERYLTEVRKLDLTILPDINAVLRFHPRCRFDGNKHPCVLALFRDVEN